VAELFSRKRAGTLQPWPKRTRILKLQPRDSNFAIVPFLGCIVATRLLVRRELFSLQALGPLYHARDFFPNCT